MVFLAFFRRHWTWLRWVLVVLAIILAVLTLTQSVDYLAAWQRRRHLRAEQAQASAAHAQRTAASAARYTRYQLDSVRRATEREQLARVLHLSQQRDAQIDSLRPARVPLPAFERLPRE